MIKCPCCGNPSLHEEDSKYAICPICKWENDPYQSRFPDEIGANHISLNQARDHYMQSVDLNILDQSGEMIDVTE